MVRLARCALIGAVLIACNRSAEPAAPRIVVSNENDGTISVIDARSHDVIATIAVGKRPRGIRVTPDGKTAYVALSGSPKAGPGVDTSTLPPADRTADGIGVVDLQRLTLVRVLPSGQDPESFDLVGDSLLAVSNEETAEVSIVDVASGAIRARVPAGTEPEGVTTAPDGIVWVTSEGENRVSAIDPQRGTPLGAIPTGTRPRTIAFTTDGALGLVPGELDASITMIDPKRRTLVARVAVPGAGVKPMGVAIDRENRRAYVTTGRGKSVIVLDLATRTVERTIADVGARPWGIAIGSDGAVYTANGPSNDISVIRDGTVKRIAAGASPWGIAITL